MARTLLSIYQNMVDEKNTMPTLSGLLPTVDNLPQLLTDTGNSPSTVAVWRLDLFIVATAIWSFETVLDQFQALILSILATTEPGTILWYQQQAFIFQFGISLVWLRGRWQYPSVNPSLQIVNRCAAIEVGGGILIKAAVSNGSSIRQLTAPELVAFNAYMQKIKYAGPLLSCLSYPADIAKVTYEVFYDPLADLTVLQPLVEAAINAYFAQISGVAIPGDFNGVLDLEKLDQAILAVPQVTDITRGDVQTTYGLLSYTSVVRKVALNAGYCIVDPANPLSSTITYTADV